MIAQFCKRIGRRYLVRLILSFQRSLADKGMAVWTLASRRRRRRTRNQGFRYVSCPSREVNATETTTVPHSKGRQIVETDSDMLSNLAIVCRSSDTGNPKQTSLSPVCVLVSVLFQSFVPRSPKTHGVVRLLSNHKALRKAKTSLALHSRASETRHF